MGVKIAEELLLYAQNSETLLATCQNELHMNISVIIM